MVSLERDPIFASRCAGGKVVDHTAAFRAAIDIVAQMDDGRVMVAGLAAVFSDQVMGVKEQVEMAVNIAYGVAAHRSCPSV